MTVDATSNVTGFTLNRLYLDNKSVYQTTSQMVSTPITAANGNHYLVLVSYNNKGQAFSSAVNFTVGAGGGSGCSGSGPGVAICSPTSGSTVGSPVTITANAVAQSGNITAIRAYIDNLAVFTVNNSSASKSEQVSQSATVAAGSHHLVLVGYESTGGVVSNSINFSVTGTIACYPSSQGAQICSPTAGQTSTSPVSVVAGATVGSGYLTAIRIYLDNAAVALVNNPKQTKSFQVQQSVNTGTGNHDLVIVGYPSTGGSVSARETITVH